MSTKNFAMTITVAALIFAASGAARAQETVEQHVTVTVRPAQSVEQRVADELKEKELRKAAEEKRAAEENAKLTEANPKSLLARARTVYVESGTSYFEPAQLQNALRGRPEVEAWQLAIVEGYDKRDVVDLLVKIDRPLFTFTFTYQVVHRATGVVLAVGKVSAFDGNAAAPKLAGRIVEEIKKARAAAEAKR